MKGIFVIECNYWGRMVEDTNYGLIYHDHFSYFSVKNLTNFGKKYGLYAFDAIVTDAQGGSLRIFFSKGKKKLTKRYKNLNDVAMLEFNFKDDDVDTTTKVDTVDFKDPPDFGDDPEGEFGTGPGSNVPPGIVEDTPGGGEFTTPPKQDNTPPGIKEDRPGSGEFSNPGRSDIGSRVSDSYREDPNTGLL